MFSRSLRLIAVLALCLAITTQASWFDGSLFGRRKAESPPQIEKKQLGSVVSGLASAATSILLGTGAPGAATTSSPHTSSSSSPPTTSDPPTTSPTSTSSTTSDPPTTETKTQKTTSTKSTTSQPSSTPTSEPSQSSQTSQAPNTQITQSPSVVLVTSVVTESGSVYTSVSSSTDTSSISKPTSGASLNNNGTTTASGMSSKTKTTVIGVVVGIGGAIILAGLAIVAWRIWGRKKENDDDDGLMGYRTGSGHEKTGSISNGSAPSNPFQSTLESYHGPTKPVNASSNF